MLKSSVAQLGAVCVVLVLTTPLAADVVFSRCGTTPSLLAGVTANDGNQVFAQYQFEFSTDPSFASISPFVLTKGQQPPMTAHSFLKYDVTYHVRVRVRQNSTDSWSGAGPACSFTPRNNAVFSWCNATPSLLAGLTANDGNQAFAQYQFEFSTDPSFASISPFVLTKGQQPPMTAHSFLKYDVTYHVRVRVRQNSTNPWSGAGPACSFTPRNNAVFSRCNATPSLLAGLTANDGNQAFAQYQFEFSTDPSFASISPFELTKGQQPPMTAHSFLKYDVTYHVRVRVRQNSTDPWSGAGPACSFAPRNNFQFASCGKVISLAQAIVATDGNQSAARYRFEFAGTADFSGNVVVIDLAKGQQPSMQTQAQLQAGRIYYVRILVKQNDSDPWSSPGPVCTAATSQC